MARPETLRQFLIMPPEHEPIFRFGSTLLADAATVWLDGPELIWMHQMSQRSLSLMHVRVVSAHVAVLCDWPVRHLALLPYSIEPDGPITPSITFQDRHGPLFEHPEPDFDAFCQHFLARLKRFRPFLVPDGDQAVLLQRQQ
jgi:hypothetical protein